MRISIVNEKGATVYSEVVDRTSTGPEFANALSAEASKIAENYNKLSTSNSGDRTMSLEDMLNEAATTYNIDINFLKA